MMAPKQSAPFELPQLLQEIRPLLSEREQSVYLVGGAVRDALLGRKGVDLDFVVAERAIPLAFRVGNALGEPAFVLDQERDIGRVVLGDEVATLDFAAMRGPDLVADLLARDFTINALALPALASTAASVIDVCGGLDDLRRRQIRVVTPRSLTDDPVRAVRAVRLAHSLQFTIEEGTQAAIREVAPRLTDVAPERCRDELIKIAALPAPHDAFRSMESLGLLDSVLPPVAALKGVTQSPPHHETVLEHSLSVVEQWKRLEGVLFDDQTGGQDRLLEARKTLLPYLPAVQAHLDRPINGGLNGRLLLCLAALFHDTGKLATRHVDENGRIRFFGHEQVSAELAGAQLRKLALSREAVNHTTRIVAGHMRPLHLLQAGTLSRRSVYRYFLATGEAGLDIGLLTLADKLALIAEANDEWARLLSVVRQLYAHYFDHYREAVKPIPLIDGKELMSALGIGPGPQIGRLLRLIAEGQATGAITSRAEALDLARRKLVEEE